MRKYEIMYIIRPDIEEEAQTALIERLNSVLTDNGAEIENVEEMGKKRFAYEIDNYRDGYYVLINFESTYEAVEEFDRDRKSTRLNSSHVASSYAVFCLQKKNAPERILNRAHPRFILVLHFLSSVNFHFVFLNISYFFLCLRSPQISTLFPYTTLFRSN